MKASIYFYQENVSYNFTFEVNKETKKKLSTVVGTAVNRFRQYGETCKRVGAKSFKFNKPIGLHIDVDEKPLFDTADAREEFQNKLTFQRNRKGAKRFAVRVLEIVEFALSGIEIINIDQLETE